MNVVARAVGAVFALALVGAAALPASATADQDPGVLIEVRDATLDGQPGRGRSLVLLQISPGASVREFELMLEFDPNVVAPIDANPSVDGTQVAVDRFWSENLSTEVDVTTGQIRVTGSSQSQCLAGDCVLFTVGWEAVSLGESAVVVSEFVLNGSGFEVSAVSVVDGIVTVVELPGVAAANTAASDGAALSKSTQGRFVLGLGALTLLGLALVAVVFARQIAARFAGAGRGASGDGSLSAAEESAVSDYFDRLESIEPRAPDGSQS